MADRRKSISQGWTSKYRQWEEDAPAGDDAAVRKLRKARKTIERTVYVLGGNDGKGLTPQFASTTDRKSNSLYDGSNIYIDSGPILNQSDLTEDERIDIVAGDALFGAACKETIDSAVYMSKELYPTEGTESDRKQTRKPQRDRIYNALEARAAVEYIRDQAPGYEGYLLSRVDYRHDAETQSAIEDIARDQSVAAEQGASLISHALNDLGQHPIQIDNPVYREIMRDIEKALPNLTSSRSRLRLAENIASRLQEAEEEQDEDAPPPSPDPGKSGTEQANDALTGDATQDGTNDKDVPYEATQAANKEDSNNLLDGTGAGNGGLNGHRPIVATTDDKTNYQTVLRAIGGQIAALRNALKFRDDQTTIYERGQKSGDIDEDGLFKLAYKPEPGEQPTIFERKEIQGKPGVQIALLCDESASMQAIIGQQRDVAATITEALSGMDGIDVRVYGYGDRINEFVGPMVKDASHAGLMQMSAYAMTPTAAAIRKIAHTLLTDGQSPENTEIRIIFVLSDGRPGGGPESVTAACEAARKAHVQVFGIGIANAYSQAESDTMYGQGHGCVIPDVATAGRIIGVSVTRLMERLDR